MVALTSLRALAGVLLLSCLLGRTGPVHAAATDAAAVQLAKAALGRLPAAYGQQVVVKTFSDEARQGTTPSGGVELVVGDSRTSEVHMDVTGNCRAQATSRQIRCDVMLLDDLASEFRLDEGSKAEMFAIILAHELGHIALNHGRSAYHGADGAISVLDYARHRAELEADAFAVALLDGTRAPIAGPYRLIEYLARTAQHRSLCPDVFPAACPCPPPDDWPGCSTLPVGPGLPSLWRDTVKVVLRGSHPEYVVRFIRMLHLSSDPQVRAVYERDALFELQKIMVRDESGKVQDVEPLFRETDRSRRERQRITRMVRRRMAGTAG